MNLQLGPRVFLQPLWRIVALILLSSTLFFVIGRGSNDWSKVIALPPVLEFLGGKQRQHSRWNAALLASALVALSLSQPVIRQSDDETWRHSTGWIVVADVSRSMTLTDMVPTRLSASRVAMAAFSDAAGARPVSLILYAGDAFLVAPPAFDKSVFDEHAASLEHGVIPVEGSTLARALSLASSVIKGSQIINARVLLLTDSGGISKASNPTIKKAVAQSMVKRMTPKAPTDRLVDPKAILLLMNRKPRAYEHHWKLNKQPPNG